MKQIFHPYYLWEDYENGMWSRVSKKEEQRMLPLAVEFTGDHIKYGKAMLRVIREWPYSCENNLTNKNHNRMAWIGHAAVTLELGIPEYITRAAWGRLSQKQKDDANRMAMNAINTWIRERGSKITLQPGKTGVTRTEYQTMLQLN